jgi:glycosyltransferase involved in cell wall biosynthesis
MPSVSAIISTYERPDTCERAVRSALAQDPAPIEVLVCDDGSRDETPERFRAWEARDPRVRYLRVEPNRGTPSPARNTGAQHARGDWLAFLDDDDEWLPGKLGAQLAHVAGADVIATNALTSDGTPYFPETAGVRTIEPGDFLYDNPVIQSSVLARRDVVLRAGGFPEEQWLSAIEDYALWWALCDGGARLLRLETPLLSYTTHSYERLSYSAPLRLQTGLARLAWRRARANRFQPLAVRAALNRTAGAAVTAARRRPELRK